MIDNPAIAIDSDDKTFMVIWSWGLRCNFDCSYCSPERHNNKSKHTNKEKLLKAVDFLKEYKSVMSNYIDHDMWYISITGGEPTANPYFVETMKALKQDATDFRLDVTTNGSFSEKIRNEITPVIDHVTISYHAESDPKIKKRVVDNIKYFQNSRVRLKVNLMMHAYEHWDECVALADDLTELGVNIVPRIIGESLEDNAFNHKYSPEQKQWMKNYWHTMGDKITVQPNVESIPKKKLHKELKQVGSCACDEGMPQPAEPYAPITEVVSKGADKETSAKLSMGRYCCGKRDLSSMSTEGVWTESKLVNHTNFKHWHCLINYYFLYIDQEFDLVFHHQTCQANWRKGRGKYRDPNKNGVDEQSAIGTISDYKGIIDNFQSKIHEGNIPMIQCPRTSCGCGVCIPKARDAKVADFLFKKHVKNLKPAWYPELEEANK